VGEAKESRVEIPVLFTDPNIVYMALWVGLWIAMTAAHAPGTMIIEVLALVALVGTAVLLLNLPTNWLAVLIFTAGVVGFILIPFFKQQYTTLSLGGLVLQALGGYFLFDGLQVSPGVIAATIALSLMYHYFLLLPAIRQIKLHRLDDRDSLLVGMEGRVVKALDPIGTVQVNSELWTATSSKTLASGTRVVIQERNGLQLFVEATKDKREPTPETAAPDLISENGTH
jgi:membrane-bound serine protease (ClpP class)